MYEQCLDYGTSAQRIFLTLQYSGPGFNYPATTENVTLYLIDLI